MQKGAFMNLIQVFESRTFQDVGTFNSIFKSTPILGYPSDADVEIKELKPGGERRILVDGNELFMDLTQRKSVREEKRAEPEVRRVAKRLVVKRKGSLPELYRKLSASEFMVYSAVKELGEVHGVLDLSRNIALSGKTISQCVVRLASLGLIKLEKVAAKSGSFTKISIDT